MTPVVPVGLILYSYPILIFLAILIPIPYLDDWVAALLRRNFVKSIAKQNQVKLTEREARELADRPEAGSLNFIAKVIGFRPIRKMLKSAWYVYEVPRGFEELSRSFYYGYLLNIVFGEGWCRADDQAYNRQLRDAALQVTNRANLGLVTAAAQTTFRGSKDILRAEAVHLFLLIRRAVKINSANLYLRILIKRNSKKQAQHRAAVAESIERAIAEDHSESRAEIVRLSATLKDEISKVAGGHLDNLEAQLVEKLITLDLDAGLKVLPPPV